MAGFVKPGCSNFVECPLYNCKLKALPSPPLSSPPSPPPSHPYSPSIYRDKVLFYGFRLFLLLSFSPPSFLILFFSGYLYFFVPASIPFPWLIMEGASLSLEGVATALTSWMFHECWLFPVCCLGVWPLWLTSWTLSCSRVETKKEHLE